ncbi:MAG: polymerase, sigma-24 subunit, subfamily [Bacteroidetes bacterium]|nr:polymerase, sigma-24 subunit, subfamily [Bacteroidota bacterium]
MFLFAVIAGQIAQNEEDLKLMMRVVECDESALSALYDRYSRVVYTTVLRMVKLTDEAEDLVQEVFLQVWNKAGMFVGTKGSVYTWIMTIARRKAIDRLRSSENANRAASLDDDEVTFEVPDASFASDPLHATVSSEYEEIMRSGLALLSNDARTIIEMSYYEGYTQEQISKKLNVPLGTVKTRMRQGLMKLRDHLRKRME